MFWRKQTGQAQVKVRSRLEIHMGGNCSNAQSIAHNIQPVERVNLQMILDRWLESGAGKTGHFGFSARGYFSDPGLAYLTIQDDCVVAPVERQRVETEIAGGLDCVTRGIYLLHFQKKPIVVLVRRSELGLEKRSILELMAENRQIAQAALSTLLSEAKSQNIYQGKSISLEREQDWSPPSIRYHELPATTRESLILPEKVMKVIEGNVLGLQKHGELLPRRPQHSLRHLVPRSTGNRQDVGGTLPGPRLHRSHSYSAHRAPIGVDPRILCGRSAVGAEHCDSRRRRPRC